MTRVDLHPEDLFDRALHGVASPEDWARLHAHLASCKACRLEHALAMDARASAAPQPDDAKTLERLRVATVKAFERGRRPITRGAGRGRFRRARVLAFAAILLFGAFGTAAVLLRVYRPAAHALETTTVVVTSHARTLAAPVASAAEPSPEGAPSALEPASPVEPPAPAVEHRRAAVQGRGPSSETPPVAESSAAELFANANALRRAGQTTEAVRAYRALGQAFAGSTEALISRVSLGRLLLDRTGDARGALAEFNGYLGRAPRGALSEEALIGRALSLGRLGRGAEERTAWTALLAAHPGSTYAARARARIDALTTE